MAARVRGQRRSSGSVSSQPGGEGGGRRDETETEQSTFTTKLYATLLVGPGIILYVYVLYIVLTNLLYPCSFSPFLSRNNPSSSAADSTPSDPEVDESTKKNCLKDAILNNAALLVLFVVQHSLMASGFLKEVWSALGLSAISRLIYVFSTCCTLQFMYHYWATTPDHILWECHGLLLSTLLKLAHTFCWLSITCSLFTIDYLELLGIKQLYYSYNGFRNPLHYKSSQQQNLLRHMRHPIFTAPFVLVWAVPVMSYDRLLVAVLLPLYMAWGSSISVMDMTYVRSQFVSKWLQLLLRQRY